MTRKYRDIELLRKLGAVCLNQPVYTCVRISFSRPSWFLPWYDIVLMDIYVYTMVLYIYLFFVFLDVVVVVVVNFQALSDLSLIFRGAVFGATGDLLSMFADTLKDRTANRVSCY